MPFITTYKDSRIDASITANKEIRLRDGHFRKFFDALDAWDALINIKSYALDKTSITPAIYSHQITTKLGRTWTQTMRFDQGIDDPPTTFDAKDYWTTKELASHQQLRSAIIALITDFSVTNIKVNWT